MKDAVPWIQRSVVFVLVIDVLIMGLKLLNGRYEIRVEAYLALACLVINCICTLYLARKL